jgi:hypothetical protein
MCRALKNTRRAPENDHLTTKNDRSGTKNDCSIAKNDRSVVKNDRSVVKNDRLTTKNDCSVTKNDHSVIKNDCLTVKDARSVAKIPVVRVMKPGIAEPQLGDPRRRRSRVVARSEAALSPLRFTSYAGHASVRTCATFSAEKITTSLTRRRNLTLAK